MSLLTEADGRLRSWLRSIAGDVPVAAEAPTDAAGEPAITAHLLALEPTAPLSRGGYRPASTVVRLRYLVCVTAPDPAEALRLLDPVVTAALDVAVIDGHRVDADLEPLPAELWSALGARPRPSLTLRIDAVHARLRERRPLVRQPLTLQGGVVRSLTGRLLGPDDVPLPGAEVSVMATGATDRTSNAGTFSFGAVPSSGSVRLAVRAKGRMFIADVDPAGGDPVVVRCNPLEG